MEKATGIKRIALIGPESTAKSTLAQELAQHYNTVYVEEYSRGYLTGLNRKYTLKDILAISEQQFKEEQTLVAKANRYIFVDTEAILGKVWCEDVFFTCPEWFKQNIKNHPYDLYLLTYPDLLWRADAVRENPHRRMFFFDWYERELKSIRADYAIIKGKGKDRLENCIREIGNREQQWQLQ